MFVENLVGGTEKASMRSPLARDGEFSETFQQILERTMKSHSSSRPPKIELSGILIPCHQKIFGRTFKFKLGARTRDFWLAMNDNLVSIARNAEWEEVTVRGNLDLDSKVLEVEKIILEHAEEPYQISNVREPAFDVEAIQRAISQKGKLEPALEYLAS